MAGLLLCVDLAFFSANVIKIPEGGWFPIVMDLVSFTVLTTWRRGHSLVSQEMTRQTIPMDDFLQAIDDVHRVNGTAVFMTSSKDGVSVALLHNLKHNQILHERVILMTVESTSTPHVNDLDRVYLHRMSKGFSRVIALMSKNATRASDFFKIPTDRVVELGTQLVLSLPKRYGTQARNRRRGARQNQSPHLFFWASSACSAH